MLKMIKPQGLYLVWVDFSALQMTHEELAFMVNEAKLWLDGVDIFLVLVEQVLRDLIYDAALFISAGSR